MRPPLYLSFLILTGFAWAGAYWLFALILPGVAAVLDATLVVAVTALVLKESFIKDPPHRM
jgi:hypothetical protein